MQQQQATYRVFAAFFALLLLFAPIAQSWGHDIRLSQIEQIAKKKKDEAKQDDDTSKEVIYASSSVQAVINAGLHLDFDVIAYLDIFHEHITPIKEFTQVPILPTQSRHIKNICNYYVAPQAP